MKKVVLLLILLCILLFAGWELRGDGYWFELTAKIFNAVVFFVFLFWLFKKPISEALTSQRESLSFQLEDAERKEKEAAERLEQIEKRMSGLKAEVEEILKKTDEAANREKQRILEQAKLEADKIRRNAEREIENRFRTARNELRKYMTDLAVEKAEAILRDKMEAMDVENTMMQYLSELEG